MTYTNRFADFDGRPHWIVQSPVKSEMESLTVARYNSGLLARVLANKVDDGFDRAILDLLIEVHRLRQGRGSEGRALACANRLIDIAQPPVFPDLDLPDLDALLKLSATPVADDDDEPEGD